MPLKNTTKLSTHGPINIESEAKEKQIGWQGRVWTRNIKQTLHDYQNVCRTKKMFFSEGSPLGASQWEAE